MAELPYLSYVNSKKQFPRLQNYVGIPPDSVWCLKCNAIFRGARH